MLNNLPVLIKRRLHVNDSNILSCSVGTFHVHASIMCQLCHIVVAD